MLRDIEPTIITRDRISCGRMFDAEIIELRI